MIAIWRRVEAIFGSVKAPEPTVGFASGRGPFYIRDGAGRRGFAGTEAVKDVQADKLIRLPSGNELTRGKRVMSLLAVYLVLMITGDVIAYLIGLIIERTVPGASLPAFLAMYFLFLWIAWVIAVRLTEPKKAAAA